MKIELLEDPDKEFASFLSKKLVEFNWQHWKDVERKTLAVKITENNEVIGGASGQSFGNWLMLERLWVSEGYRGKNIGHKLLTTFEKQGVERGCRMCLLDTLDFQAKPFYEKNGYKVQWIQEQYPKAGSKYFMVKTLR